MTTKNLQYWLYDTSSVTPWYFWPPEKESSLNRLKSLWVVDKEEEKVSSILSTIKGSQEEASLLSWVPNPITAGKDLLVDAFEWGKTFVWDIQKISKWQIQETEGLLWDILKAGGKNNGRIEEFNALVDETGGNVAQKITFGVLSSIWAGFEILWEWVMSAIKTITPEEIETDAKEWMVEFGESDTGKMFINAVQEWGEKLDAFEQSSPQAKALSMATKATLWVWLETVWVGTVKRVGVKAWEEIIDIADKAWDMVSDWVTGLKDAIPKIKDSITNIDLPKLWNNPSKIAENIAWIDERTKNVLKESTTEDFNKYVQIGKDAAINDKNPTPMDVAWKEAFDVLQGITSKKKAEGKKMGEVVKGNSDLKVDTTELNTNYSDFLRDRFNLQVDPETLKITNISWKEAKTSDIGLIEKLNDDILSITTLDDIGIDNLEAIWARIKSNFDKILNERGVWSNLSADEKSLKWFIWGEITGMIKKNLPEQYSDASSNFGKLLDIETRLSKLLGDKWDKWGSFIKSYYSPQTWERFRRLAEEIFDETGVDLGNKAWLAKFAMQLAWDSRQANLLEALDLWEWFTWKLTSKLKDIPIIWNIAELWEMGAKKLFPTEKVGRWLTK